jgi:hypothetical protein
MSTLQTGQYQLVRKLYLDDQFSAREISEALEVSLDAVYYFLRKYKIPRRDGSENRKAGFRRKPASFKVKEELTKEEELLRLSGCLLYWCEGYKTEKSSGVDFANSDLKMVTIFLRFLRDICMVDEARIRVLLYCHDKDKTVKLTDYWSEKLLIPKHQFTKPYVMKVHNLEKKDKMPYGLVHIRYYDKKLLMQILEWIEEIK